MNSSHDVSEKIWVSMTVNHWQPVSYTNVLFNGEHLSPSGHQSLII